ncbi:uroporphyrinogen-III synthase [Reinekea sp.]|uniref:uroporphyrinogen-III synthase n=1 Tax=Reinekea sp. TaxID=1970455 RepID=UPI0039897B2D
MNVIVPKAAKEWARWQLGLESWTSTIVWIDPWQFESLAQSEEVKQLWMNIDQFKVVHCVSPEAAQALIDQLDIYWPMIPAGVNWTCNGPGTANVLNQHDLPTQYPEAGYTAEDVIELVATLLEPHDSVLIVKGEGGRNAFKEYFASTGQKATEVFVYRRLVDNNVLAQIVEQADTSDALWLSSSFLGEALLQQNGEYWRSWSGQWWVSSDRLKQWCLDNGLVNVKLAADASVDALATMLRNQQGEL